LARKARRLARKALRSARKALRLATSCPEACVQGSALRAQDKKPRAQGTEPLAQSSGALRARQKASRLESGCLRAMLQALCRRRAGWTWPRPARCGRISTTTAWMHCGPATTAGHAERGPLLEYPALPQAPAVERQQ